MAWFTTNWFWVLVFIAMIAMHLFGHGSHGSHGGGDGQQSEIESEKDGSQRPGAVERASQHHH